MPNNILITGYPYVRDNYLKTFDFYPEKQRISFLLPRKWKVKKGKVLYYPPKKESLYTTRTFFHHSDYYLIGGLFKGFMPSFPFKLLQIKKDRNINLVYNCNEPTLLTTLYNAFWIKMLGLKNIVFSWENIPYDNKFKGAKGIIHRTILMINLALADGVVCGNKKCLDIFSRLTDKPLAEVPLSGLDDNFFRPLANKNRSNEIAFAFIGAISYRKGIHLILEAFSGMLKSFSGAKLVIAGSGELDKLIDEKIKQLNLGAKIKRLPWISHEDLLKILQSSDIFLYPSLEHNGWQEQFGYSMAEASLCELPVIATDSGSIGEVVVNDKTGILVRENDVDVLEKAMLKLAQNKELRETMGKAGREYISNNYSYKIIADKFFNFFNSIY